MSFVLQRSVGWSPISSLPLTKSQQTPVTHSSQTATVAHQQHALKSSTTSVLYPPQRGDNETDKLPKEPPPSHASGSRYKHHADQERWFTLMHHQQQQQQQHMFPAHFESVP